MTMWDFAASHPFTAIILALIAACAFERPFYFAAYAYNRKLRAKNIFAHGYPTAPVDADGDVVYPKVEP